MPVKIIRRAAPRPATLADVITALKVRSDLSDRQRRDLISAVTRTASLLNRQPCEITSDAPALRAGLKIVHPVAARISAKRLANIKSDLIRALELTSALPKPMPRTDPSPEWEAFRARGSVAQSKALSRLARYCTARGIEPAGVTDAVMAEFRDYLHPRLLSKDPLKLSKDMAWTWNSIVQRNGLALPVLTVPKAASFVTAPLSAYPASLQADIDAYLERLRNPSLFSDGGIDKPLRPTTLRNIKAHIRQLLDAAVAAGYRPSDFHSLADIVDIEVLAAAFDQISERLGGGTPPTLHNIAATVLAIGRHYVEAPAEVIQRIANGKRNTARRLGIDRPQMTEKNMERLAQFEDPSNIALLVNLPGKLMRQAQSKPDSRRSALAAMYAVAITMLLACPMRMANLAELDIEKDLTVVQKGAQRRYLVRVESPRTKNGMPIDFQLNADGSRLLSRYLDQHRCRLANEPGTALFPTPTGKPRSPRHFGEGVTDVIWRETGLIMNPHLFRHLAGLLFLQRHPGEFETVRRLLGHRKIETTMGFYARFDTRWAAQRYDEEVLSALRKARR